MTKLKSASPETCLKISQALKRKYPEGRNSPQARAKISISMSKVMRERWRNPESRNILLANLRAIHESGILWTGEIIQRQRQKAKERWATPQYRTHMMKHLQDPKFIAYMAAKSRQMWEEPEFRNKVMVKILSQVQRKPNTQECRLMEILNSHFPGQWEFTGDGKVILNGLIPDFANVNSKKSLIEFFGDYWHSGTKVRDWKGTELGRIMAYNSLGYHCLVIWEHELENERAIIDKVKLFSRRLK